MTAGSRIPEGRIPHTIAILDFGSQYNQLIARRVRECRVYFEILDHDIKPSALKARKVKGVILSGGPASIFDRGVPKCDPGIFELGVPVLGICYGVQLMAHTLGGKVTPSPMREYGPAKLELNERGKRSLLFAGLEGRHPFPGPDLAVRILGPITKDRLAVVRKADAILRRVKGKGTEKNLLPSLDPGPWTPPFERTGKTEQTGQTRET